MNKKECFYTVQGSYFYSPITENFGLFDGLINGVSSSENRSIGGLFKPNTDNNNGITDLLTGVIKNDNPNNGNQVQISYLDSKRIEAENKMANCIKWAKAGECIKNPLYMAPYCKQSCEDNNVKFGPDEDKNDQCSEWAKAGECIKNPLYMAPNCNKSCKNNNVIFYTEGSQLKNIQIGNTNPIKINDNIQIGNINPIKINDNIQIGNTNPIKINDNTITTNYISGNSNDIVAIKNVESQQQQGKVESAVKQINKTITGNSVHMQNNNSNNRLIDNNNMISIERNINPKTNNNMISIERNINPKTYLENMCFNDTMTIITNKGINKETNGKSINPEIKCNQDHLIKFGKFANLQFDINKTIQQPQVITCYPLLIYKENTGITTIMINAGVKIIDESLNKLFNNSNQLKMFFSTYVNFQLFIRFEINSKVEDIPLSEPIPYNNKFTWVWKPINMIIANDIPYSIIGKITIAKALNNLKTQFPASLNPSIELKITGKKILY